MDTTASTVPEPATAAPAADPASDVVRLVVEPLDGSSTHSIDLPQGTSYLVARGRRLTAAARRPAGHGPAVRVEVLGAERAAPLALFVPAGLRVRLNGLPAPVVAPLRVKDQVQLDSRTLLHVTACLNPRIETPAGELLGRSCGLCRRALDASTRVYVCPCGVPLHLEGPEHGSERLECAHFGDCPSCERPVRSEGAEAWMPELRS